MDDALRIDDVNRIRKTIMTKELKLILLGMHT